MVNDKIQFNISESAASRITHLLSQENDKSLMLRVSVEGGGCSGFKYKYDFDNQINLEEDLIFEKNGINVIVDKISLELINGSTLDYTEELGGAYFEIRNPNASSGCGCGNSFSI